MCRAKNAFAEADRRCAMSLAREALRAQREAERALAKKQKEAKRLYLEARQADARGKTANLAEYVVELENILKATLDVDDHIHFNSLKEVVSSPPFDPGKLAQHLPAPLEEFLPPRPTGLARLVPGAKAKHDQARQQRQQRFDQAKDRWKQQEQARLDRLGKARAEHDKKVLELRATAEQQHAEIELLQHRFAAGDSAAIAEYFRYVLEKSVYPGPALQKSVYPDPALLPGYVPSSPGARNALAPRTFPKNFRIAYVPESKQLVVDYELPTLDVVPEAREHRYVKAKDEVVVTTRPKTQRHALYASVVAQMALRTVHELFESDRSERLDSVVFSGYVATTDKRTGKAVRPYLVTLRTTRDTFLEIDLSHVDPKECLKHLSASVSASPADLAPVRPVLEFNMVDSRFVEESDVLSSLDERPNLMELTPSEFEALITNLFEKMGLETRMTTPSRDGGVDCVAYDPRPIFGGKVVIQAKRYKNTVGVSAVRDLFGTLQNEGASKGILVTTSGYGRASFDFANGKPIELLDGGNLLYLLKENAGIDAKIIVPDDWVDPEPDS